MEGYHIGTTRVMRHGDGWKENSPDNEGSGAE